MKSIKTAHSQDSYNVKNILITAICLVVFAGIGNRISNKSYFIKLQTVV